MKKLRTANGVTILGYHPKTSSQKRHNFLISCLFLGGWSSFSLSLLHRPHPPRQETAEGYQQEHWSTRRTNQLRDAMAVPPGNGSDFSESVTSLPAPSVSLTVKVGRRGCLLALHDTPDPSLSSTRGSLTGGQCHIPSECLLSELH